ncbi:MAG: DUF1080 domain-containing protein [Bacteroidales bacterium]|jgi:hypothetical protein
MRNRELKLIAILLLFCSINTNAQEPWTSLIRGNSLRGWKQLNGTAKYEVKDGQVIGRTVPGSPNSFLCTVKEYGDFILEFDVWVDPSLNSGVQIRSHSMKEYQNGRVHGYQIEIDPSERAWSAGIYDEARRAWLYTLEENPAAQKAFRQNQWNRYRIEAIGHSIRTWINGVPAANLTDDLDASGFIALQVHSVGNDPSKANLEVKWRDIRILTTDLDKYQWFMPGWVKEISTIPNTLTRAEMREGWQLLWDGQSTSGWRGADQNKFPQKGWEIINRTLTVNESGGAESSHGGDIITVKKYADFELSLDFRLTKGANSGIKYLVIEGLNQGSGSAIGLEYQLLDDDNHPDANQGVGGNRKLASVYDLIPAPANKPVNPPSQWNNARLVVSGNHVEHWLNGVKMVEYDRNNQLFNALVQKSKYSVYPGFGNATEGHILLQDHGNRVSFRNIKIKTTTKNIK